MLTQIRDLIHNTLNSDCAVICKSIGICKMADFECLQVKKRKREGKTKTKQNNTKQNKTKQITVSVIYRRCRA